MATTEVPPQVQPGSRLIAPIWHTVVLLVILLGLSALSARFGSTAPMVTPSNHLITYAVTIIMEWLIFGFIWFGVRRRGVHMRDLVGGGWPTWKSVARDLGIAVLFLLASNAVLALIGRLLKTTPNPALRHLVPHGPAEIAVWLLLALTAGICEEVIFRGYLQKQLGIVARSALAGLLLQAIVFGAAHGYQGWKLMLTIFVYGCFFGWLANWRKSLRPGMTAHFLQDAISGIAAGRLLK